MAWEICRVCLQSGELVSLFDCDENNELLSNKYTSCSSIEVSEDDNLPCLICLTCVDKLMSAYQFRQQCIVSNETLSECITEFKQTTGILQSRQPRASTGTETIRIKRENGSYLEYDIPVEEDVDRYWPKPQDSFLVQPHFMAQRSDGKSRKRGRGRPRKYPNELGEISLSPYQRRKDIELKKSTSTLLEVLKGGDISVKTDDDEDLDRPNIIHDENDEDPDYFPDADDNYASEVESEVAMELSPKTGLLIAKRKGKKGRGKRRKIKEEPDDIDQDDEDVLLKETILANSAPIPDSLLNPQPKERKKYQKKRYHYDKIHTCDQCGASFRSNASLQAHIRRHLGIKPFVCNICGYACVLNMELRRHMLRHTGLRPYQCRICDRRFGDFGSRQKHERLHLGERPYQCLLCNKNFTYSYVLANHMLTHTGEKKFSCEPCNKRFTKAHHLKYHNKVHHKEIYLKQEMESQNKKMRNQLMMNIAQQCSKEIMGMISDDGQPVKLAKETTEEDKENEAENGNEAGTEEGEATERDVDQDSEQHSMQIEEDIEEEEGQVVYQSEEDLDGENAGLTLREVPVYEADDTTVECDAGTIIKMEGGD